MAIRRFALGAMLAFVTPATAFAEAALTVEGTEFVLTTIGGRVLRSADLAGATLQLGNEIGVTIQSVEEDREAVGGRVWLHHFIVKGQDLCTPDAQGRSLGFPVPDDRGGFELTCTSGAVAKCLRWGYRFWEEQPGGPPLRALHQACVHMARADYGGDGRATTREGTLVYVCDRFGVRPCAADAPLSFEAAWGRDGAVCVAHPRIPELISLQQLAERFPRLKPRLGPAACSEDSAMRDPAALLFNRSQE